MAADAWLPGTLCRMEFIAASAPLDEPRQEKESAHPDYVQPVACSRFCRSFDISDIAAQILPPLKAGMIVLADRYVYTAFARDVARGVHPEWVRQVYSFALRPDLTLYFRVPIEISLERLLAGRAKLKYHEAGMDVTHAVDPVESFRGFQSRVLAIYDQLSGEFGLKPIDATGETTAQQRLVRKMVQEVLLDYDRQRAQGNHGLAFQAR